jgi:hypothetical protein
MTTLRRSVGAAVAGHLDVRSVLSTGVAVLSYSSSTRPLLTLASAICAVVTMMALLGAETTGDHDAVTNALSANTVLMVTEIGLPVWSAITPRLRRGHAIADGFNREIAILR